MVRHYDMASGEMILDPQTDNLMAPAETAPATEVGLRLQTVAEATLVEAETRPGMPADLSLANPLTFIDAQR